MVDGILYVPQSVLLTTFKWEGFTMKMKKLLIQHYNESKQLKMKTNAVTEKLLNYTRNKRNVFFNLKT